MQRHVMDHTSLTDSIRHQLILVEWSLHEHAAGADAESYIELARMRFEVAVRLAIAQRNSLSARSTAASA